MSNNHKLATACTKFFIILCLSFLIIYIRASRVEELGDLLWNEDGKDFLAAAQKYNLLSIILPYGGYLVVVTRLFSCFAVIFPLVYVPLIFFVSTLLIYALSIFLIFDVLYNLNFSFFNGTLVVALFFFMPLHEELLLNLTNSQWFLSGAFILYAVVDKNQNSRVFNVVIGMLCGLNGPFVIFYVPILWIKLYFSEEKKNRELIFTLSFCFFIQFLSVIFFPRSASSSVDISLFTFDYLFFPFKNMISGFFLTPGLWCEVVLWGGIVIGILIRFWGGCKNKEILSEQFRIFLSLFAIAAIVALSSYLVIISSSPTYYEIYSDDVLHSSRYIFLPCSLFLFSVSIILSSRRYLFILSSGCFALLFILNFEFLQRSQVHFNSFLNFSKYAKAIALTNNIGSDLFPKSIWYILIDKKDYLPLIKNRKFSLSKKDIILKDVLLIEEKDTLILDYKNESVSAFILFSPNISCPADTSDVVLKADIESTVPVKIDFMLSPQEENIKESVFTLYHGFDLYEEQFALPYRGLNPKFTIRLTGKPFPIGTTVDRIRTKFKNMEFYCLPPHVSE